MAGAADRPGLVFRADETPPGLLAAYRAGGQWHAVAGRCPRAGSGCPPGETGSAGGGQGLLADVAVMDGGAITETGTMGIYQDQVLPRVITAVMNRREFAPIRGRVCGGLKGEVLEIGFGSGLNLPHCPPAVTRVRAVDPAAVGRRLAAKRVAASGAPVEYIGLDGQALPLEPASVDHVVATWTLCTIPDVERALGEVYRVLRPGGSFHFVDHGRSPDPGVARWQDWLTVFQRRLAGGCHLNRPISRLVADSGLELTGMATTTWRAPSRSATCSRAGQSTHERHRR